MRKFIVLLSVLFASVKGLAQTTLINSTFETGDATAWSFANDNPNAWVVGTAVAAGGNRSAYISNNNGNSNQYAPGASTVSHMYSMVNFPAGQGAILLSFDVKGIGEHGTATVYDYVRVSLTGAAPSAGKMITTAEQLPVFLSAYSSFNRVWVAVPSSYAGTAKYLVFTFRTGNTGGSTAFAIDNVKLTSAVAASLSGTKTIKPSGGTYASFSEAIATLNANGAGGALTFNVDAGTTFNETPTAITVANAPADITFQKSGAGANPKIIATGSGNSRVLSADVIPATTDAVIALAGADRIVFDGIDFASADYETGKSAVEYGVYVYNESATNGAQNNSIRNAAITLNKTNLQTRAILQNAAATPTSAAGANSANKYYNLTVTNTFAGIELQGAAAYPDLATEVGTTACAAFNTIGAAGTPNDIGNGTAQTWGIRAVNQSGVKIFNNKISNVTTTSSGALSPVDGILVEDFMGTANEIYNNQVTGIAAANGANTSSASGINLSHPTSGTHSIKVYNNFVSGITHGYTGAATGGRYIRGIFISGTGGGTTQSYAIDFNSVRIDGSSSPNASSAALEVATTSGPVYYIRNNILSNFTGAQSSTAKHYGIVSTSAQRVGNTGSVISYNDLYIATAAGGYAAGGGTPTLTDFTTVSAFQAAFTGTANNLNPSVDPAFASTTDLHSNATGLNGKADPSYLTNSSWITKDIDCETRASAADIGADEFSLPTATCTVPAAPTTLTFSGITAAGATGSFTAPAAVPTGYVIVRSTGTLSAGPVNGTSYAVNDNIGNGTVIAVGTATNFSLAGLTANTAYTITVFPFNNTNCTNGPVYNATAPLTGTFTTCPATPSSPVAVSLSPSSFQLSFTSSNAGGAAPVTYNLEVATDAAFTAPVSGSPFTFADNTTAQTTMTYTVTGLTGSTIYYYRLKANGCNSNTVTGSVTTWCDAVPVPYFEGFESITAANTLPACMTASPLPAAGGKTQTYIAPGADPALKARTGTKFAAVYYSPNGAGYFFSAPLQLTKGMAYKASVYYKANGVAWSNVGLKYGTAATVADTIASIAKVSNAADTGYTQITGVFTPATTGVYYVSFYAENNNSAPNYIAFDDLSVEAGSTCSAPVQTAATAITATGATLTWTAPVPAPASYEVYYSTSGTAPTVATQPSITGVTGTSRALAGLAASTTYYAWVRSNCGSGVSAWSSVISFTTLCAPVNVTYTENFDGAAAPNLPACTTKEDVNNDGSTWTTVAAPAGYSGQVLQYTYSTSAVGNAANDWFYTRGLNLTVGTSYTLSFKYGNSSSIRTEKLKVAYGNAPSATAMTNLLRDFPSITGNAVAPAAVITFTPAATGVYYIGFQAYSDASQSALYLDDISVIATPIIPANDEATGAFTLTAGVGCAGAAYTNAGATKSANEVFPSCSGTGQTPVWFKFVATGTAVRVSTDVGSGNTLTDSKIALFSATNPADYSTFTILSCDDDNGSVLGSGNMSVLYATGLTLGTTYYVAVDKSSAATSGGTFCITVDNLSADMLSSNSQCAAPLQQAVGSNTAYVGQVPLVDGSSKLIAIVKTGAGEAASSYAPSIVVSSVPRQSGGRYYLNRNFGINNGSSKATTVQLFFLATELASLNALDGTTLATLAITRQSGSVCLANFTAGAGLATPLAALSNGTSDGVNWIEANLPAGMSNLYLNKSGIVLPVNLLSFSGQRLGSGNLLKWTVEQEQDVAAYEVERSENNRDWTTAGSVNSLGNTAGRRSYSFTDNNVQGLKQYYRLRQVDRSGAARLSSTIVISGVRAAVLTLNGLFPNPAASKINLMVEAPAKDNLTILVMDAVGKVVKTQKAFVEAGANTLGVNVAGLAQGSYLVRVTCEGGCETATGRFIKE